MGGGEKMSETRRDEEEMAIVVERIVMTEHNDTDAFIKIQKKRLRQLHEIQKRKEEGKNINYKRIISELQNSGILDENGNLAEPYSRNK